MIARLKAWWDRKITLLVCKLCGHCGEKTIEVYEQRHVVKNYVYVNDEPVFVKPFTESHIYGKHRCGACGTIFLGFIVKEHAINDKPHGTS